MEDGEPDVAPQIIDPGRNKRATEPWKMASRMLRHKSLIQAARVAFGFSGIHDEDEARDIGKMRNVTPTAPSFVLPTLTNDAEIPAIETQEDSP